MLKVRNSLANSNYFLTFANEKKRKEKEKTKKKK